VFLPFNFGVFFSHHLSPAPNVEGGKSSKSMVFVEELTGYLMKFERTRTIELLRRKPKNTNCLRISSKKRTHRLDKKSIPRLKFFLSTLKLRKFRFTGKIDRSFQYDTQNRKQKNFPGRDIWRPCGFFAEPLLTYKGRCEQRMKKIKQGGGGCSLK